MEAASHQRAPALTLAGRYRLDRLIARGGMADVFEARDLVLDRAVAVKRYRGATTVDRDRFDAEVLVLAAMEHRNLVRVYDAGEDGGDGFVVLELVSGPTLRSVLEERGPLPAREVAALGTAVARALAHVHDRGVVHRDVTPANILCPADGPPRLTDFGIARLLDTTRITATATTVGTAAYMAPEQVEGSEVTPAADVYALGLVLHEALTGRRPFAGDTPHEVAVSRLVRDPDLSADLPPGWRPLLSAMTARSAGARPPAHQVADRLEQLGGDDARLARTGAVVVGGAGARPVDGHGPTSAMAAVDGGRHGTTVMPAALRPRDPDAGSPTGPATDPPWRRPAVLWAAAALALLVLALTRGGGGNLVDAVRDRPAPSTTAVTADTPTTVTTAPPPTTDPSPPPPPEHKGKEEGKGKGKGGGKGGPGGGR